MSRKKKPSSVAIASEENKTVRSKRLKRKTEFYAKSVHCKGNVVLKSAHLTATADLIDLTDVRDEDNDSNDDCVF